jgi:hypothetical protein
MLPQDIQHRQVGNRPPLGYAMPDDACDGLARDTLAEFPDEA